MANERSALGKGVRRRWRMTRTNPMKGMWSTIKKRAMLMDTSDWVTFVLWFGTLILMFEFIGIAATNKIDPKVYANGVAAAATVFAAMLFAAILTTVILRLRQKRREGGGV